MFKIAKFEFKVTVRYSLWAKCTQLWPLKSCCITVLAPKYTLCLLQIWSSKLVAFYKRALYSNLKMRSTIKFYFERCCWLTCLWRTTNITSKLDSSGRKQDITGQNLNNNIINPCQFIHLCSLEILAFIGWTEVTDLKLGGHKQMFCLPFLCYHFFSR